MSQGPDAAYGEGKLVISPRHIQLAITDTEAASPLRPFNWLWLYASLLLVLLVLGSYYFYPPGTL